MKFWLAVGGLVLALSGVAEAQVVVAPESGACSTGPGLSTGLACSQTFTATAEHRRYKAMGRDWHHDWITTEWIVDDKIFAAMSDPDDCKDFGRFRDVRVREDYCDGRYMIEFWSVGEPAAVTFEWQRQREIAG